MNQLCSLIFGFTEETIFIGIICEEVKVNARKH